VIVTMTPAHIDALMPFEHVMFGTDAWPAESYAAELADTDLRHYLAVESEAGELLGWGGVMVIGESAEILTIGVVPTARRHGLATELLHSLLAEARRRGARECFLEVREDNDAARAFYDREGFRRTRLRRGYYDSGRANAVEMYLGLNA
jgi:ribosomal-protein-alanine N-acetyltransferase